MLFNLYYYATVRLQAINSRLPTNTLAVNHWLGLTFADRVQAIFRNALANKVSLDIIGAALRQAQIIASLTDTVAMASNQDKLDFRMCLHLLNNVSIKHLFAGFLNVVFVEVK